MKHLRHTLLAATVVIVSCQEKAERPGEECSVKLPGIHFTKSLNHAVENTKADHDQITITSGPKTDYFNEPDGKLSSNTAPVLLSRTDNTKPFTFTAQVTPSFVATYDAGALYIYSTDQWWLKFAFERDEQGRTRIVSVRTTETSDDNNHDVIAQESVYMKISSDTRTVGFYYSTDGTTWNLARLYKNNYPETIWLGVSPQSPTGDGNAARFEHCTLTETSIKDFRTGL